MGKIALSAPAVAFAVVSSSASFLGLRFVLKSLFSALAFAVSLTVSAGVLLSIIGSGRKSTKSIDIKPAVSAPPPSSFLSNNNNTSNSNKGAKRRPPPSTDHKEQYRKSEDFLKETAGSHVFPTVIRNELGLLIDLIVRDFIIDWYRKEVSPDSTFVNEVQASLAHLFAKLGVTVVDNLNLFHLLLDKVPTALSMQVKAYRTIRAEVIEQDPHAYATHEKMKRNSLLFHQCVAKKFADNNKLHAALTMGSNNDNNSVFLGDMMTLREAILSCEMRYVRIVSKSLCKSVLCDEDYNCGLVNSLMSEIINTAVLIPVVALVSEPSNLNHWLLTGHKNYIVANEKKNNNNISNRQQHSNSIDYLLHNKHDDDKMSRHYDNIYLLQPGAPPDFLSSNMNKIEDSGWLYFGGVLGETESALLLKEKEVGSYLIRKGRSDEDDDIFIVSYVGGRAKRSSYENEERSDDLLHARRCWLISFL